MVVIRVEHDDDLVGRQRVEGAVVTVRGEKLIATRERRANGVATLRLIQLGSGEGFPSSGRDWRNSRMGVAEAQADSSSLPSMERCSRVRTAWTDGTVVG